MKILLTMICAVFLLSCSEDILDTSHQEKQIEKTAEMLKFEQSLKGMGNKVMNSTSTTQKKNVTVELNTWATEYLESNGVSVKKSDEPILKQALDLHAQKLRETRSAL